MRIASDSQDAGSLRAGGAGIVNVEFARRRGLAGRFPNAASRSSFVRRVPAVAALATLILVAACSGMSKTADEPGASELLRNHLSVASAALAAGQPDIARRVYASLVERFDEAPEPVLGLGYVALYNDELDAARRQFLRAAGLAQTAPATRGEALLGAGRASLALGDSRAARQHLLDARPLVRDPSSAMWIENGLAVAAVLEADYETAQSHYTEALRHPSAHPRIAANFVRMLIASGQNDAAAGIYDQYDASFWEENDSRVLQDPGGQCSPAANTTARG